MQHTIIATDHKELKQHVVNNATYTHTLRVNGDRVVTFEIEQTENNQYLFENVGRRWKFFIDNGKSKDIYVVQNVYEDTDGDTVLLTVDCLYQDYDILKREMVNKNHTGSKTRDSWFIWLFEGSSFKMVMEASPQLALTIDNFGFDSRLSLLFQLLDKFNLEFYIQGKTVYITDGIGQAKEDYVSYGINLVNLSRTSEMGEFGTQGTMFGALKNEEKPELGHISTTYTHPLASEYGIIPIKPIVDERFKFVANMKDEIKKRIEASINISVEVTLDDLFFQDKDVELFEGDTIRLIDERIGLYTDIRIVEVTYTRNDLGELLSTVYTLGNYDSQYTESKSDLDIKNQVNKDLPSKIESSNNDIIKDTQEKLDKMWKEYEEKYIKVKEDAESAIEMAGRSGKIFRQILEPKDSDLNQGDLWYKPKWLGGTTGWETEMYQYEKNGNIGQWRRIMDVEIGDANHLEKGTINAKVINLINLNADEIVAGKIRGKNLSIDLDTGEVLFTRGTIKKTDGSFTIDVNNGTIQSRTADGRTYFNLSKGSIGLGTTNKPGDFNLGRIGYIFPIFNAGGGMTMEGNESWGVATTGATKGGNGAFILGSRSGKNPDHNGTIHGYAKSNISFQTSTIAGGTYFNMGDFTSTGRRAILLEIGGTSTGGSLSMNEDSSGQCSVNLFASTRKGGRLWLAGETVSVTGDMNVTGKKNAIHVTRDGVRETPAYEMATAFIGDIGEVVTSPSGMAIVEIPDIFYDIANFDKDYQVFLTPYDFCQFRVTNRTKESFIIETDKGNCRIGYEIKALRRGYEDDWFAKQDMSHEDMKQNFTDFGMEELNNV